MQTLYSLRNEKEARIIRAIIEELKAGNQTDRLTLSIVDHIPNATSSQTMIGGVRTSIHRERNL